MGKLKIYYALTVLFIFLFSFAPSASGQEIGDQQNGLASWYGAKYHGRRTSSGEIYNRHKLTAAHNKLPLGSKVKVTNTTTGESVVVRINDRGPFRGPRIIDVSEAAARKIHFRQNGLAKVTVEVIELPAEFLASRAKSDAEEKQEVSTPEATEASSAVTEPVASAIPATVSASPVLNQSNVFVIQAGAYSNLTNAEAEIEKLKKLYQKMPIALVEETVNGRRVHRILAGRFVTKATAEQARQDLSKKGFKGLVREMTEQAPLASL